MKASLEDEDLEEESEITRKYKYARGDSSDDDKSDGKIDKNESDIGESSEDLDSDASLDKQFEKARKKDKKD